MSLARQEEEAEEAEDRAEVRRRAASVACKLVWEGSVVKAHFRSFKVESKGLETARRYLKEKGCEHYLDMALRFEEGDDDDDDDESDEEEGDAGGQGPAEGEEEGGGDADGMQVDEE